MLFSVRTLCFSASVVSLLFFFPSFLFAADDGVKYAADAAEFQSLVLSHGAIGAYFAAFVLGIVADLSPCVYPLIPVTLALIGAKEAPTKLRAFSLSAVYVLGIAVMSLYVVVINRLFWRPLYWYAERKFRLG